MRFLFVMLTPFLAGAAVAQSEIEYSSDAEFTLVAGLFNDNARIESEALQAELSASGGAEYVLDNGVEISGRLTFRAQTDHPNRPGFAGSLTPCEHACVTTAALGYRGGFSRLTSFPDDKETGALGSLEEAFIAIDGGWGELVLGRDAGVAQRFYEGGPSVFALARSANPILDPTGLSISRTRNDISSTAEKVSYVTPRLLGVRAGISYTPDASVRRLDLNTKYKTTGVLEPELDEAVEIGLQGSRLLRDADLRVRGSLTWSQAQTDVTPYDNIDTVSAGLEIERRDAFQIGFSVLDSSNGGLGDYTSYAAGAAYWLGDWKLGVSGDFSEDKTVQLEGWSGTIGVSREVLDNVELNFGYRHSQLDHKYASKLIKNDTETDGVLLEVRIRK